ncbi:recombinase family protein [Oerskovia sp. NPDC060338]|uniref:recombinase family protein n=1 Tax=Oerskovia sp. NPDC060338 TaxID=3347100 RepID=UPI0036690A7A
MKTAAIYVRISRDTLGDSLGVERQEAECRSLADRLGFAVSRVYKDNDVSATSGKIRPDFERLMSDAPAVVIVWHTDRLVRLTKELERVIDAGMVVHAVTAGHLDLSTASGRATARTVTAWATYEGEQKGARQRAANAQAAASGKPYWRRRPFGWNLDGTLVEEEAQAIRAACENLLAGWALAAITREWVAAGLLTPKSGSMGGNEWTTQGVRRVLMAARIAGIREYKGQETPGTWTPAVSEDTWRAVYSVLANPARGTAPKTGKVAQSLLAGIARCGKCGGLMHSDKSRGDLAYRCTPNRHLLRKAAPIDALVFERTADLLTLPGVLEATFQGDDPETSGLHTERAALLHRRDVEMPDALAAGLSLTQVVRTTNTINARLAEIEEALTKDTSDAAVLSAILNAPTGPKARERFKVEVWDHMPLEAQRAVVRALWAVTVEPLTVTPTAVAERLIASADAQGARAWFD